MCPFSTKKKKKNKKLTGAANGYIGIQRIRNNDVGTFTENLDFFPKALRTINSFSSSSNMNHDDDDESDSSDDEKDNNNNEDEDDIVNDGNKATTKDNNSNIIQHKRCHFSSGTFRTLCLFTKTDIVILFV
jgi:hypothetical protein